MSTEVKPNRPATAIMRELVAKYATKEEMVAEARKPAPREKSIPKNETAQDAGIVIPEPKVIVPETSPQKILTPPSGSLILQYESTMMFTTYPAFNVSEKMHLVQYTNKNFMEWFGNMSVSSSEACTLNVARLVKNAIDYPTKDYPGIIPEVGEDKCETSIAFIFQGCEKGVWSKDLWYFTYAKDSAGLRRAVDWNWLGDGWDVCAHPVPRSVLVVCEPLARLS